MIYTMVRMPLRLIDFENTRQFMSTFEWNLLVSSQMVGFASFLLCVTFMFGNIKYNVPVNTIFTFMASFITFYSLYDETF